MKNPPVDPLNTRPDWLPEEQIDVPKDDRFGPRIKLMQGLSPEITPGDDKFIAGLKLGDIAVVTGNPAEAILVKSMGEELEFVPIALRKSWSEFVPRKQGGGFVALYTSEEELKQGYTPGNEVQLSIDVIVKVLELEEPALLQFNTPTKLKPARTLVSALEKFKTLHGMVYGLSASMEKNRQQQSYYNFAVRPIRWVDKGMLGEIKELAGNDKLFLPASSSNNLGNSEM